MTDQCLWVIDTKVLISRLLAPRGMAAQAVDRALEGGILLASDATLEEVAAVLSRPRFDLYVSANERQRFIALLGGITRVVPITHKLQACRDPRDDKFLDVALAGGSCPGAHTQSSPAMRTCWRSILSTAFRLSRLPDSWISHVSPTWVEAPDPAFVLLPI